MNSVRSNNLSLKYQRFTPTEAEFKEFEPRLKFETRLKYGWFHWQMYSMFQDLGWRSIEIGFWLDLKRGSNFKFGLRLPIGIRKFQFAAKNQFFFVLDIAKLQRLNWISSGRNFKLRFNIISRSKLFHPPGIVEIFNIYVKPTWRTTSMLNLPWELHLC